MRCLVLGGTGFIGTAACKELMRRGVETIAASRTPRPYGVFTSHVAFDRRDQGQLARAMAEVAPDVLLDLACYQASEVEGVLRCFRGARYVFISTGVYPDDFVDRHGVRPAREEDFQPLPGPVPGGVIAYRDGKRWCETVLARSTGFPWTVIRPPAVFGAGDPTLRIAAYLERVEDGNPLLVPAETWERQAGLAWVRDVGYACALACDPSNQASGGAYNVALEGVSLRTLIESMARALNTSVQLKPVPYAELTRRSPDLALSPYGPDPSRSAGYSIERARHELGFEPSTLEDALAETLAWYRVAKPSHPGYQHRSQELAGWS